MPDMTAPLATPTTPAGHGRMLDVMITGCVIQLASGCPPELVAKRVGRANVRLIEAYGSEGVADVCALLAIAIMRIASVTE